MTYLTDKGVKFGSALDSLDDASMMVVRSEIFTETISGERIEKVGLHISSKNHQIGGVKVPSWLPL